MADSNITGDMVHVSDYTRSDGTHVDDYYRAKPGGGSLTGNNSSNNIDVPGTVSDILNSLGDKKTFEKECPALTELFGSVSVNEVPVPDPGPVIEGGVQVIRIVLEGVVKLAQVAIEVIIKAAPAVAALYGVYLTGKAVYDKVSGTFSPNTARTQIKTVKTTIQGLKETQKLQKRNFDLLSKKAADAKNQEEYSKLYEELAKQKIQYEKNNTLLDKIEYSAQEQDWGSVQNGLEEYLNDANQTIEASSPLKGSVEKFDLPAFDTSYFEQGLPYKFENSHKSFKEAHKETFLTEELINSFLGIQPAGAEEIPYKPQFTISPDGTPMLKTGLSYNDGMFAPKTTPTKVQSMAETGEALSAGRTFNDLIRAMGEDSVQGKKILKQVMKTYNSPIGAKIEASYQTELRTGVQKILNECIDSMKAIKIAGNIAEKVAPYLAVGYIFQKTLEGFANGGLKQSSIEFFKSGLEVVIILTMAEWLGAAGMAALPAFAITLIVEYVLNLTGIFK